MGERDLVSWNVLISVYVKCKRFEDAVGVYVRMRGDGIVLFLRVLRCGIWNLVDVAREIFDGLPKKNVISWTSMVSGYVSCGMLDEARRLFDQSPVKDIVLWTAIINGYVQFNHVDEAMS
ncbi:pentatricopeptide repeat (PPR-like) superfamily protein [Artemisia annua]|uniref:Pentatricopeptide repeat (PPR-like) superfamily protein n=1 Tax=Artemisia annua TaxID=35608 RepID=A0A2U1N3H1_ARTAN|nr:pentatricopeptide repeat (PPR-like) superfamily protein [Artemisia annua]